MGNSAVKKIDETTVKLISYALLFDMVIYTLPIYFVYLQPNFKPAIIFNQNFYTLIIPVLILVMLIKHIKNYIWQAAKKGNTSEENFYSTLMVTTVIAMALLDMVGVLGLFILIATGKLQFSLLLFAISFIGKITHFPTKERIANKKKSF